MRKVGEYDGMRMVQWGVGNGGGEGLLLSRESHQLRSDAENVLAEMEWRMRRLRCQ